MSENLSWENLRNKALKLKNENDNLRKENESLRKALQQLRDEGCALSRGERRDRNG